MTLQQLKTNFLASPKSTLTGIFSLAIAIILAVVALPPKSGAAVIAVAVLRCLVDFTKQDADKAIATTPANPEPHAVPAQPAPSDPAATAVSASPIQQPEKTS